VLRVKLCVPQSQLEFWAPQLQSASILRLHMTWKKNSSLLCKLFLKGNSEFQ
ncbi:hypothetical protein STEG23_033742, partial [Scotinomys teguina]